MHSPPPSPLHRSTIETFLRKGNIFYDYFYARLLLHSTWFEIKSVCCCNSTATITDYNLCAQQHTQISQRIERVRKRENEASWRWWLHRMPLVHKKINKLNARTFIGTKLAQIEFELIHNAFRKIRQKCRTFCKQNWFNWANQINSHILRSFHLDNILHKLNELLADVRRAIKRPRESANEFSSRSKANHCWIVISPSVRCTPSPHSISQELVWFRLVLPFCLNKFQF